MIGKLREVAEAADKLEPGELVLAAPSTGVEHVMEVLRIDGERIVGRFLVGGDAGLSVGSLRTAEWSQTVMELDLSEVLGVLRDPDTLDALGIPSPPPVEDVAAYLEDEAETMLANAREKLNRAANMPDVTKRIAGVIRNTRQRTQEAGERIEALAKEKKRIAATLVEAASDAVSQSAEAVQDAVDTATDAVTDGGTEKTDDAQGATSSGGQKASRSGGSKSGKSSGSKSGKGGGQKASS